MKMNFKNIIKNPVAMLKGIAICATLILPAIAKADPVPVPVNHPTGAAVAIGLQNQSDNFLESALQSCRANSPFANIDAPEARDIQLSAKALEMVEYAKRFLGRPYVWGAVGPTSFDCSGFTSYVYRHGAGVDLLRTSSMQYTMGRQVSVNDLKPGDLLFFSSARSGKGRVGHVAIVASVDHENKTCKFIHASTRKGVVYQQFPDNAYYSRNFIGAKRIL